MRFHCFGLLSCAACAALAFVALSGAPAPAAAQDPLELRRLSGDQHKLAEQGRRLKRLLEVLEERERASGNLSRADFLAGARERLDEVGSTGDLAVVLEGIAADLLEMRTGAAMETQAELIHELQSLLDYLLERQMQEQLETLLGNAVERMEALAELVDRQEKLLRDTQRLRAQENASGEVDDSARQSLAERQSELNAEMRALAEEEQRFGFQGEQTEQAAEAGEEAAREIDSETAERMEREARERSQDGESEGQRSDAEGEQSESDGEQSESDGERSDPEAEPSESEGERAESQGERSDQEAREGEENAGEEESEAGQETEESPGEEAPAEPQESQSGEEQSGEQQSQQQPSGQQQSGQQQQSQQQQQQQQSQQQQGNLQRAEEKQQEALDNLQGAMEEARQQAEQLDQMQQQEQILNLMAAAMALLERHRVVDGDLATFVEQNEGRRANRRQRVDLRKWSEEETNVAEGTSELLLEINESGADSVPFLLRILREDHERLARYLGPPRYRAGADQLLLSRQIIDGWEELIETLQTEAERLRQRIEQPQGGGGQDGEPQEPRLVSFVEEMQLLKRMEEDLRDRIHGFVKRREVLAAAGMELDPDDIDDMEQLLERQSQLRLLYDAILQRLEEDPQAAASEEEEIF